MKEATQRSILRWIHIVFSIPILGYIYSPFEEIPKYADRVRFVVVPVMLLSGLWMWKGHVLRRLVLKRPVLQHQLSKYRFEQSLETQVDFTDTKTIDSESSIIGSKKSDGIVISRATI